MPPLEEVRFRFERLSLPLKNELYRASRALAGTEADALDLLQETYLRAWKAFARYREDQKFRPWLFTILRRAHVDSCRRRRRRPATADPGEIADSAARPVSEPLGDDIRAALERLRPAHHMLLLLRDMEGFTYQEMAEILDWPAGSVMSGLHNARAALRAGLKA
jgi:RNA polymerase sigma-70 factor (ECF subfamily)